MIPDALDPLDVLRGTRDPDEAQEAMLELHEAGFRDVVGIARDCGWLVRRDTTLARLLTGATHG